MELPAPEPGLVIRYAYLWHSDYVDGREEGSKDRPCAIVAALREDGRVLVVPITHAPPTRPGDAVPVPPQLHRRLGLDDLPCWVVVSEFNVFVWPGPDLRPIPADPRQNAAYGFIPPGFFRTLKDAFLKVRAEGQQRAVPRTE